MGNKTAQLSLFEVIVYGGNKYFDLMSAMISAMQDFYVRKIIPENIYAQGQEYNLKKMKKYWNKYELQDFYPY